MIGVCQDPQEGKFVTSPCFSPSLALYYSTMYLAKMFQRRADGSKREYWVLKASYWDPKTKRPRHRYLAYVGTSCTLSEKKARKLARKISEKLGRRVTVEDLRKVKRLRIM